MAHRKTGRPTKLTADVEKRLVWALQMGSTYAHACQYAGIGYSTFRAFMTRGEAEKERLEKGGKADGAMARKERPFLEFWEAIKSAEGRMVVQQLMTIENASKESWQAAAWKLERRYPKEYGRQMITITHEEADVSLMNDEELAAYIAKLESGSGEG